MIKGHKTLPCAIHIGHLGPDRQISTPFLAGVSKIPAAAICAHGDGVFEIDLADAACYEGWYPPERDDQTPFRWTGPGQVATIVLTLAPCDYAVLIAYDRPVALTDENFAVTANGHALAIEVEAFSAASREARFTIPAAVITDGALRLEIDVGAVLRPSEHGGEDERSLGIVVHRVLLVPLQTRSAKPAWSDNVQIRSADLQFGGQEPETWGFKKAALLLVPNMLDLPARTKGDFTDIAIDVAALIFSDRPNCVWELEVRLRDKIIATRPFRNFTQRHQIIVPTNLLHEALNTLHLSVRAVSGPRIAPRFFVRVLALHKDRLVDAIEHSSVWVFSTARSGSSWLSQDILCHSDDARSMDEPGIGRLFAPVDWVAERFYDLARKDSYAQSGLDYETKAKTRADTGFIPPFERSFMFGEQETNIWSPQNRPMYLDLIRTTMFQHVLHEWGVIDYRHIVFKMPNDSHAADVIMQALPNAFMILLMRDGRDVMKSRFSPFASQDLANSTDPALRRHAIAFYAHLWNFQVDIMQAAFAAHAPERKVLLRYEELRVAPTAQLRAMFDMIGMEISNPALDELISQTTLENIPAAQKGPDKPRQTGQIGQYADVFSDGEITLMEAIMGPNLRRNGYQLTQRQGGALTADGNLVLPVDAIEQHESGEFEISLTEDIFGAGWYRAEFDGPTAFRWTGPGRVAELSLRLAPRDYAVHINYDRPEALGDARLMIIANDKPLLVKVDPLGLHSYRGRFTIPAEAIAAGDGAVRLAIDVGEVIRPSEHGGTDSRMLGIVVFRIALNPIEPKAKSLPMAEPAVDPIKDDRMLAAEPPAAAIEPPAPPPVPIVGDAERLGTVTGLSMDRWVGPELRVTLKPHRPVQRVTVHGWFHGETPTDGELRLRIGDQTATQAMMPGLFAMSIDPPSDTLAPITLAMDATDWMMLEGPTGRKLVFVLQRIALEHGG